MKWYEKIFFWLGVATAAFIGSAMIDTFKEDISIKTEELKEFLSKEVDKGRA